MWRRDNILSFKDLRMSYPTSRMRIKMARELLYIPASSHQLGLGAETTPGLEN
jgi:hypothetical protein